jgi:hypothetical protein
VIARRFVWPKEQIQDLLANFVLVADEVHRLQMGSDAESCLAQKIFEQGHFGGQSLRTATRQGIYAATADGRLLASVNTNDPERMAEMLRQALREWEALSEEERRRGPDVDLSEVRRSEDWYPEDGLVLRTFSRDLPRPQASEDWRGQAWNQDYAWFTREEARDFLPDGPVVGAKGSVPRELVERLARFNLVDNVRGQVPEFDPDDLRCAYLESEVVASDGTSATVRFRGQTEAEQEGTWSVEGFRDMEEPNRQRRGVRLNLSGQGEFDIAQGRLTRFEILATGTRFGASQFNGRHDDREESPIGFLLTLAGNSLAERVAPSFFYAYGWDRRE